MNCALMKFVHHEKKSWQLRQTDWCGEDCDDSVSMLSNVTIVYILIRSILIFDIFLRSSVEIIRPKDAIGLIL